MRKLLWARPARVVRPFFPGLPLSSPVHSGFKKIRQKLELKKIVKLTDHTYACNSLTNFECEVHGMTGNVY